MISLGKALRNYRLKKGQNITAMANKIGMGRTYLSKIENDRELPSLPVINELINYLNVPEDEALGLLKKAGFGDRDFASGLVMNRKEVNQQMEENKAPVAEINVPQNIPVLYTDSIFVTTSKFGVVLDFAQNLGPTNKQNVVARIGLSREHAEALLEVIGRKLTEEKLKRLSTENVPDKKGKN